MKKVAKAKGQPSTQVSQSTGQVGARGGGYGPKNSRTAVNTGGRRGSKLRGGQSATQKRIYRLG